MANGCKPTTQLSSSTLVFGESLFKKSTGSNPGDPLQYNTVNLGELATSVSRAAAESLTVVLYKMDLHRQN